MKPRQTVAILVTLLILGHAFQTEYFVKPSESTPCPALPCHTLSHYLEDTTRYFTSNTRISFLHGVHEINRSGVLLIQSVFSLTLTGYKMTGSNAAKIICTQPATLMFYNMANLVISHLSVLYCGYPVLQFVNGKELSSAAVYFLNIIALKLSNISVEKSNGYGVVGVNVLGNSSISHSRFLFNNHYTLNSTNCSPGSGSCKGGNMHLFYESLSESAPDTENSVISIESCMFRIGVDISEESSGLSVYFYNAVQDKADVISKRSTRYISLDDLKYLVRDLQLLKSGLTIRNPESVFRMNSVASKQPGKIDTTGKSSTQILTTKQSTLLTVQIFDSKFFDNIGGGVHIELYMGYKNTKYQVFIKKCSFQRNLSPIGSSIRIAQPVVLPSKSGLEVLIQDTEFMYDTVHAIQRKVSNSNGFNVVAVYELHHFQIINCTFVMNKQTALQVFDSTVYFGGQVVFSGNNGSRGGAMMLQGGSRFYLMPHAHIQITNNYAKRGGGIYVEDQNTATTIPCFFQILKLKYLYSVITLENNTAQEAGNAVYGGRIDQCYLLTSSQQFIYNSTAFTRIFNIVSSSSPVSQVSSNPVAVHVCKHKNISRSQVHEDQVYPGQMLKIPVVLYGQRDGSVPGIVRGELVNKSRGAHFAPLQETQQTKYSCTNLTYTISSTGYYESILLRVDGVQYYEEKTRALVNVTLLPCPPGFQLSNLSAQCDCNSLLKDRGLSCNISGAIPLVHRTKSVWISIHPNRNDTILHDNCPLDYCKPTSFWLQLEHPDEQCAYKHSGLLCGRCKSNLSLAIGTSQCLECTNIHLTLLLPFALAGLMLVLFLIVCNLTVSMGTINGLIFYANIVRVNHTFFFGKPPTFSLKVIQQVLAVFIAWLNLDLGIETCFFHGMDAYIQTWLQFAFPFYIWIIVGVIIYLSRCSTTIVKLVGSSAVSVLATLFLLSYTKLQRTVITAFSFTYLQNYHEDGRSLAVWLYDGNIPFLQGKHIGLFLMALIVTVFFILPFTLLLLFAPCIQASNHFVFKWLKMKLCPLLDAYQAPYKGKFRFWTALMLAVRSILLVGYGLNILGDPDINHLLTVTVLSILLCCIWMTGIVYKTTTLSILEASFILNLLILTGWTIYNRHASNGDSSDGQTALVCTNTGIAFSTFICIIFYHTYLYLKSTKLHLYFKRKKYKRRDRRMNGAVGESVGSAVDALPHHPPTMTAIELREPLLTDNN